MTEIEKGKHIAPEDTYRIMLLDAPSRQLDQIKVACKKAGQEVVAVNSVDEAKQFLETKNHVDVIVAEAFLQEDNIFELLKVVKEDPRLHEVPVLLMAAETGSAGKQFIDSIKHVAHILGVYSFVYMKQFDVKRLMLEIRVILADSGLPKKEQTAENAY
jgi:CheY-like chemotaxis protein